MIFLYLHTYKHLKSTIFIFILVLNIIFYCIVLYFNFQQFKFVLMVNCYKKCSKFFPQVNDLGLDLFHS